MHIDSGYIFFSYPKDRALIGDATMTGDSSGKAILVLPPRVKPRSRVWGREEPYTDAVSDLEAIRAVLEVHKSVIREHFHCVGTSIGADFPVHVYYAGTPVTGRKEVL